MRIAMIGSRGGGGIATHINELSKQLEMRGNHVTLISPRHLVPPLAIARYVRKLAPGYDIIHVHGDYDVPALLAGLLVTKALRGGTVFTTHGTGSRYWRPGMHWGGLWRYSAKRFNVIISVSEFVRRRLVQVLGENPPRHYTIYNGVDTNFFSPAEDSSETKRTLGVSGKYVLLYVGRLVQVKGLQELIKCLPAIREQVRNVSLVVCGEGEMEAELRSRAISLGVADCIDFRGLVTQQSLPLYYNASDVVVVPSIREMMGIVLLEGMSMKKPIVASRVGGIPEIVKDMETGLLVPPLDTKALTDAVLRLQKDPELAAKMGENGRRIVETRFTWERITGETMRAYSDAESG